MKKFFWFLNCLLISSVLSSSALAEIYTIKGGDTLSKIAARLSFPLSDLLYLNSISSDKILRPGDQLIYISESDRQRAATIWATTLHGLSKNKNGVERDELMLWAEAIAADFFQNKIYYNKKNPFPDGKGVHASFVFMDEKEIKNFIKGK